MNIIIEKEEFLNEGAFIGNIRDFINEEDFNNVKDYSNNLKKYIFDYQSVLRMEEMYSKQEEVEMKEFLSHLG